MTNWLRAAMAIVLVSGAGAGGCASGPRGDVAGGGARRGEAAHEVQALGFAWFGGTVEEGFAASRVQGKPLFLYWGAVWCPPCRALKAEVFPQQRFAERMRGFIPVYLDGDAPEAQRWADRLRVLSYPAMLVLDGNGAERMRILGAADIQDVDAALAAALSAGGPLSDRVARAIARPESLAIEDWVLLSLMTWNDPALEPEGGVGPVIATLTQLVERVPATLPEAGARLAGALLAVAAEEPAPGDREADQQRKAVRGRCNVLLGFVLRGEKTVLAARAALLESAPDILVLCAPDAKSEARASVADWLARAVRAIGGESDLPVETRLDAIAAEAKLWHLAHPEPSLPAELRERAQAQVHAAMAWPIPDPLRHTVVTSAAGALHALGDDDGARTLLLAELKVSKVPWYLQGELASIAADRGEGHEALARAGDAVRSAQGAATPVQWRVNEIRLLLRFQPAIPDAEIIPRLRALYDLIFALPDGFAGRNRRRLAMVQKALAPLSSRPSLRAFLAGQRARCAALDETSRAACEAHLIPIQAPPAGGNP